MQSLGLTQHRPVCLSSHNTLLTQLDFDTHYLSHNAKELTFFKTKIKFSSQQVKK